MSVRSKTKDIIKEIMKKKCQLKAIPKTPNLTIFIDNVFIKVKE
jgi:hypothetical protein